MSACSKGVCLLPDSLPQHTVLILLRDRQKKRENVLQGVAVGAQSLIMGDEGQPARMEMDVVDIVSALQKTKAVPEECTSLAGFGPMRNNDGEHCRLLRFLDRRRDFRYS